MKKQLILAGAVMFLASRSFADEAACKKWNEAYKEGLIFASEQIKKNPDIANKEEKNLSLKEIQRLEKSQTACEVKQKIESSLLTK